MANIIKYMPDLEPNEALFIKELVHELDEEDIETFINIYRDRRRKPQDMLIFSVVGLFVVPGLQRFVLGQIWMGLLYLFTIGLCFVGSVVDLINYRNLALEYNEEVALDVVEMIDLLHE